MKRPSTADTPLQHLAEPGCAAAETPDTLPLIDPTSLQEFTELMGTAQARFWLQEFRAELCAEFAPGSEPKHPEKTLRERVHHYCGRAGFIGFSALHAACVDFLEHAAAPEDSTTAHDRIRVQAERACAEIERLDVQRS